MKSWTFYKLAGPADDTDRHSAGPEYLVINRNSKKPVGVAYDSRHWRVYDPSNKHWTVRHPNPDLDRTSFKTRRDAARFLHNKDVEFRIPDDNEEWAWDTPNNQPPWLNDWWEAQGGRDAHLPFENLEDQSGET